MRRISIGRSGSATVFRSTPPRTDRGALSRRAGRRSTCSARRTDSSRSSPFSMCTQWPNAPRGASWKPDAHGVSRPDARLPFRVVVDAEIAGPMFAARPSTHVSIRSASTCVSIPRARDAAEGGEERLRADAERLQHRAHELLHARVARRRTRPACARAVRPPSARRRTAATSAS